MATKEYSEIDPAFLSTSKKAPFKQIDVDNKVASSINKTTVKPRKEKGSVNTSSERPKIASIPADSTNTTENPYFASTSFLSDTALTGVTVLDKDWARQAFLVSDTDLSDNDNVNRYWSSASRKFTDTRMGGNIGINARPQFTRYSDVRVKGRLLERQDVTPHNTVGNYGMGRYYSEAIDDNAQTIYLRFGVPQFSSLVNFFSKAFDPNTSKLARTGSGPSFLYSVGKAAGTIASVRAFPVLSTIILGGRMLSYFFTRPTSKYYTMKPTMHLYWSAVQSLVNTIAVNKGLLPRADSEIINTISGASYDNVNQTIGTPFKLDSEYLDKLAASMPDMFTANYGIDVFAIANRAQRIANNLNESDYREFNDNAGNDFIGRVQRLGQTKVANLPGSSFSDYVNHILEFGSYYVTGKENTDESRLAISPKINPDTGKEYETLEKQSDGPDKVSGAYPEKDSFLKFFDAEFREGSGFAVFKVDHTGAMSESFANSVVESDISKKFNNMSSDIRESKFSLQGGNITGSALEGAIKGLLGGAMDVAAGIASGVSFGITDGLAGLGSGFIDVPKHWQSSSASLPRSNYTMQLISPYGNIISQMQNIFIPLAMIMAGSLPLSTGKQSYTSPFLCQLWDRGRQQIQLGMIESLSIQRGTCNLPFTNKGNVLAIDVSFSVVDLSSIMHMPISTGSIFGVTSGAGDATMDEDNILFDYLAVLAGQDIYSQYYAIPKARLNFAKKYLAMSKLISPAYWASAVHDSATSGMLQKITLGAGNLLEGLTAGANTLTQSQR